MIISNQNIIYQYIADTVRHLAIANLPYKRFFVVSKKLINTELKIKLNDKVTFNQVVLATQLKAYNNIMRG